MRISLANDAERFEFYKGNGDINLNGFLKTMIVNYFRVYSTKRKQTHADVVNTIIETIGIANDQAEDLATNILNIFMDDYPELGGKNEAITLTVSGKAYDTLGLIEQSLRGTFSLSQYLRNLFSSYLASSRSSREKVIFSEEYDEILGAIRGKKSISFFSTTSGERKYIVAPYAISSSKDEQYNYVLCYDLDAQTVRSFRLSRIKRLFVRTESFQLDQITIDNLKKAKVKGAQFAFAESPKSSVKLTEKGLRKFRMIYTNRPEIIERNGNILTFEWPLLQLEEYFKRFGKDAIILEPKSSRENMIKFYSEAYEHYSNN